MERVRQSPAWWRLAAALTFGLALVAVPAAATTGSGSGNPTPGLAQMAPVTANAVVAVLRAAPTTAAPAVAKSTGGAAVLPAAAAVAAGLAWLAVRRRTSVVPASRAPRSVAARAPPSTVGL